MRPIVALGCDGPRSRREIVRRIIPHHEVKFQYAKLLNRDVGPSRGAAVSPILLLVAVGWMYVVTMMAVAEAMAPTGTVLGAVFTFLLYGVGPLALVLYLLNTPSRRRRRRAMDASAVQPDGSGHAAGDAVAPEREEP
jgi:hypothetical protein